MKYSVILHVNDKKFKAEGDSVLEALKTIDAGTIKTTGVFEVKKGKKTRQMIFNIYNLRRIFANDLNKLVQAKKFELMLN
jgi:SHS2 domain-containing protein